MILLWLARPTFARHLMTCNAGPTSLAKKPPSEISSKLLNRVRSHAEKSVYVLSLFITRNTLSPSAMVELWLCDSAHPNRGCEALKSGQFSWFSIERREKPPYASPPFKNQSTTLVLNLMRRCGKAITSSVFLNWVVCRWTRDPIPSHLVCSTLKWISAN